MSASKCCDVIGSKSQQKRGTSTVAFAASFACAKSESVTGKKRSAIYESVADGTFPAPVPLGARAVGWLEDEIADWQERCIALRDKRTDVGLPLSGSERHQSSETRPTTEVIPKSAPRRSGPASDRAPPPSPREADAHQHTSQPTPNLVAGSAKADRAAVRLVEIDENLVVPTSRRPSAQLLWLNGRGSTRKPTRRRSASACAADPDAAVGAMMVLTGTMTVRVCELTVSTANGAAGSTAARSANPSSGSRQPRRHRSPR